MGISTTRAPGPLAALPAWERLAAPIAPSLIAWRQDGKPIARDGRFFARWVAYIEANTVRERLDAVVPGEWDLTLELLPAPPGDVSADTAVSFKARLQILGVIREDVGSGKDYKQASTDAFKRAAVRFGIGHELYAYEQNWVEMSGGDARARPVEDPAVAYARKIARLAERQAQNARDLPVAQSTQRVAQEQRVAESMGRQQPGGNPGRPPLLPDIPACPKCGDRMWDNRLSKRNPKAPDYKCRDRTCDGVIWPGTSPARAEDTPATAAARRELAADDERDDERDDDSPYDNPFRLARSIDDDIPF